MRSKLYIMASLPAVLLLILFSSCTRRIYIPVESRVEHSDTLLSKIIRKDSMIIRDSIVIEQRGDTIKIERWRDRWRNSISQSDSVRILRDSTFVDRPVMVETIKEVPRKLSWWQKLLQSIGIFTLLLMLYLLYRKIKGGVR